MSDSEVRRDARLNRRGRVSADTSVVSRAAAYRQLVNPFEPLRVFSDDQVAYIHERALDVLERSGIRVLLPQARDYLSAAGASVEAGGDMVRLDRGLVARALSTAPATVHARAADPSRHVTIGGRHVAVVPVSGPPNVSDRIRGRRPGTLADYEDFVRLSQHFDVIHLMGPSVEPLDVAPQLRHLKTLQAQLSLSDKVPFVFSRGTPQVAASFEMIRLARGLSEQQFHDGVYCYTNINTNSPRQLDLPMSQGIIDFAAAGQLSVITPFTLAGAMAPITIPGALTLAHAEALAGITLSQVVRAGAPVVYGGFTSNVDMKSGSPAFGTPEYAKACYGTGQLARHVGLPWRSSNATAANAPDEQSVYESAMSLMGAFLGGCNVLIHGAGWLEGGLTASLEKYILDIEQLQMFAEMFQPLLVTDEELGLDAIAEVAPGGHFFSAAHTMERFRNAFYTPLVSDWRNYGQWAEDGARTAGERATGIWQRTLAEFVPPTQDSAALEAVGAYVRRQEERGGALPVS